MRVIDGKIVNFIQNKTDLMCENFFPIIFEQFTWATYLFYP